MKMTRSQPGVFVTDESIVRASRATIEQLKAELPRVARGRVRLCAHPSPDSPVHEMLIAFSRDSYITPHRHPGKSESFHVIAGEADLVVFGDDGSLAELIALGEYASGGTFYYRMPDLFFHTVVIRSDIFVTHETSTGPFVQGDAEFAPWAPREGEADRATAYLARLRAEIAAHARAT